MIVNSINSFSSTKAQNFGSKQAVLGTISTSDGVLKQATKAPIWPLKKVMLPIALAASVLGGAAFTTACSHTSGPDPTEIVDPVERNGVQKVLCDITNIIGVDKNAVLDTNKTENSSYIPVKGDITYFAFEDNNHSTFSCTLDKENSSETNLIFDLSVHNAKKDKQINVVSTAYRSDKGVIFTVGFKRSLEFVPTGNAVDLYEVDSDGTKKLIGKFSKGDEPNTIDVLNTKTNKTEKAYNSYIECQE